MKESIAVTGGRGMLGSDLVQSLNEAGYRVKALDLPEFDLTRPEHVESGLSGADVVINCAAFTNVDKAEEQPVVAMMVNGTAVGLLGEWAAKHNAFVIHISTDFVFNGESDRPYLETDRPDPLSVYGRSKLEGEGALARSNCHFAIIRLQWSYGQYGTNFIAKLLERAKAGGELRVVNDQVGAPTWTLDIARAIRGLVVVRPEGIFHFANAGYATRYDVASFIARKIRLTNQVVPCLSSEFPGRAIRPKNSRFCTDKIKGWLDHTIRSWDEAMCVFLDSGFQH